MDEQAYVNIHCPHCGTLLNVREEHRGAQGNCRHCGGRFVVPANEELSVNLSAPGQTTFLPARKRSRAKAAIVILLLFLVAAAGSIASYRLGLLSLPKEPSEPMVYLSEKEPYYYYEIGERARSLGIQESSPRFRESFAVEKGYQLAPLHLRDRSILADLAEQEKIKREVLEAELEAQQEQLEVARSVSNFQSLPPVERSFQESLEAAFRSAIIGSLSDPASAVFGPFSIYEMAPKTYRVEVDVDLFGNREAIQPWTAEVLTDGKYFNVSFLQGGQIYRPAPPLIETRKNKQPHWKIRVFEDPPEETRGRSRAEIEAGLR